MTRAAHDLAPETALAWHRSGQGAALATVVETWGSAPRLAGSQMAVSGAGEMTGSVSGGCVEGAVVTEAIAAIGDRTPRLLTYGVSDETAYAVGLACGGTVRVLLEPVGEGAGAFPEAVLADLVVARTALRPVALATRLDGWSRELLFPGHNPDVDARLRSDLSGMEKDGLFIAVHNPPLRLIIIGAVQIAQPLLTIARTCGYAPRLIDPRGAFGSDARFPGEAILDVWPDEALAALAPDARTAIVTLSHDPKLDDPALVVALASPAFYIGALGSSKTHAKRLDRLSAQGLPADQVARIHAPVGLAIGACTPAEIAVSILAEITATLRAKK